ncbi:MAG: putative quinol monooxygenase [Vicinamibacteria bacterium]|jgi:quinol monooxygenase YgiN
MLIVIGRVACAAGKRDELVEAMREMQTESRKEPGALRYGFFTSIENPDEFIAVEEWESREALQAHFAAPSVAGFGAKLGGLIAGTPEVAIHHIERTTDFPNLD